MSLTPDGRGDTMPDPSRVPQRYLLAMGISAFGAALGFLAMTTASTEAGGPGHAGLFTALVTAVVALGSLAGTALAPRLGRGMGTLRVVLVLQVASALGLAAGGALLLAGQPVMPVLVLVAFPVGLANGVEVVLRAPFARLLTGHTSTSQAYARLGVVSGVAFAAGAVVGGLLLLRGEPGLGLLANAALLMPLTVLLLRMDPALMPAAPAARRGAWAATRESLGASPVVRLVAVATVVATLLVLPFQRLVAPLISAIRPDAALVGVAAVLAASSLGLILAPRIVTRLRRGRAEAWATVVALAAAGAFVLLLGVAGALPVSPVQLVLLVGLAFLMGAFRQAFGSLRAGVTASARGDEDEVADLASIALLGRLVFPVGLLAWGLLLDLTPAPAVLGAFGSATVVLALLLLRRARSLT